MAHTRGTFRIGALAAGIALLTGSMAGCSNDSPEGSPAGTTVYPVDLKVTGAIQRSPAKVEQNCWTKPPLVPAKGDLGFTVVEWSGGRAVLTLHVQLRNGAPSADLTDDATGRHYTDATGKGITVDAGKRVVTMNAAEFADSFSHGPSAQVTGTIKCRKKDPR
jgi:hypothetical protein